MEKKKNRIDKRDIVFPLLLALLFLIFVVVVMRFKYCYGSTLDWESQHYAIPDYFRMLFYKTHDLFPDFAFNLGSGQNIYNFAYYGLLSPIILLSYFLPFIDMMDYVAGSSIAVVIISGIIFYFWLRKNKGANPNTAFLASFTLIFATSMSFHSHRHVMFMNYMPFMILGLFGVDKKLETGKGWLLSLSVFLMIMTSYYYSVGGIIILVLYGVYRWIELTDRPNFKLFFKDGIKFLIPFFVAIAMASIIILPTLHVILSSRGETFNTITWKDLLIPGVNIEYMLYNTYGVGLTAILIVAIVNLLFKNKHNLYLGIVLALMIIMPVFNYILNATMYIDAKALIPVLPLAVYAIYILIDDLIKKKCNLRKLYVIMLLVTAGVLINNSYVEFFFIDVFIVGLFIILYTKFDKKVLLAVPIILVPVIASFGASLSDELVDANKTQKLETEFKDVLSSITDNDDGMYRISNAKTILRDVNNLYGNIDYYTSTIYSSTYNMGYNKFYYDVMNNPIQNRNRVITSPTSNILFLMFSGNKYLIDNKANYFGYELYKTVAGDKIYRNTDVLPLMYARSDAMSEDEFDDLDYPDRAVALLSNVVVSSSSSNDYVSPIREVPFREEDVIFKNVEVSKKDGFYQIEATSKSEATFKILEEYRNKIIFIRFKVLESEPCSKGDTSITIDGVKNKLTCKEWKYHNQNYDFDYILANKDKSEYKIEFADGTYKIRNIEVYALDYDDIKESSKTVDEFKFDKERTRGDLIAGEIDVKKNGYFVTSVPYDEGFKVRVDGVEVESEKVNTAFLGFKIGDGHHEVEIEYEAPYKKLASYISLAGIFMFIILSVYESKKTTS